ncbi:hypothetical protein FQN50_005201 [Emmonsiellopsis sp. PD_5]|nr:hypothetical protein FQN50_005201 [Emmonsiellopsis sp. PD_5]
MTTPLPPTMRAIVRTSLTTRPTVESIPTPQPTPGSAIVQVIHATIHANLARTFDNEIPFFTHPLPHIPGGRALGRIAATGPDATILQPGQLVLVEPFIRARDDPNVQILFGTMDGPNELSKKFTADNWRDGTLAEYVRAPLENCAVLDEKVLCGSLGYELTDLVGLEGGFVAYGGLRSVGLSAGETVIVAPATGAFSGAAVDVAVAMGANVVACGRNEVALARLVEVHGADRVRTVVLKGDVEVDHKAMVDAYGREADVFFDISPPQAEKSTHVRSGFMSLRQYGRAVLMGVINADIAIPYSVAVWKNLTIRGQYMYEREDVNKLVKMAESGVLKIGRKAGAVVAGQFKIEDFEEAIKCAFDHQAAGQMTLLTPGL